MRLYRTLSCLVALIALAGPSGAQDVQTNLHLAALLEEARLLLEEFQLLDPVTQAVREEDERLRVQEGELSGASAKLAHAIDEHNRAANDLARRFREHRQQCPRTMSNDEAIEACNNRGARLIEEGKELDRRHTELAAEQQEIHRRVALFNSSRQSWIRIRREHLPKLATNEADSTQWVARAQAFTATPQFASLSAAAGQPESCATLRGWSPPANPGVVGLRRLYACLTAIVPH